MLDVSHKQIDMNSFPNTFSFIIEYLPDVSWTPVIVSIAFAYAIYWFLTPKNIIKDFSEVGYDHLFNTKRAKLTGKTRLELAEDCRRKKIIGNVPPVYPNGWFVVMDSDELGKKQVKQVNVLGLHLAVFRGENGQVHIVSAMCPHLGANLAAGGQVQGDCIQCPFHGWKFSGNTGKCVEIPYSNIIPEEGKIKTWPSCEINSFIWIWHHAENEPPYWQIPSVPPVQDQTWWYRGRTEHYVNSHIQEIPENGADVTHISILHEPIAIAGNNLFSMHKWWTACIAKHVWKNPTWVARTEPAERHIGTLTLISETLFFNRFTMFPLNVTTDQIGPGFVLINAQSSIGPFILLQAVTPVEPMVQRVVHKMFYPLQSSLIGTMCYYWESILFERDVAVWNHKMYANKPLLTKEDACIARHRRWYNQFYSKNSPRLNRESELEW